MKQGLELKLLPRNRIFQLLDLIIKYPLTMLITPMGYGKTVSLRNFISERKLNHVWVTVSKSANMSDADLFWFMLIRTIAKKDAKLAEHLAQMGFPKNNIEIFRIIDLLEEINHETPVLLVIDDLHFVEDNVVYDFIYQIVCAGIPWLRIVILSRSYPPFPIEEMELKRLLYLLGTQELAFTEKEAEDYFSLVRFDAPADIRSQIYQISHGWISSLFLLAAGYLKTGRLDGNISVNDMFNSSLFSHYTEEEQKLLIQLALLDSFSLDMVDYIFEDNAVSMKLLALYRANAFIFHDQQRKYYFHQMFRDFLLTVHRPVQSDNTEFLGRVAQWYSDKGHPAQAINYWMMTSNCEKIMGALEILPPLEVVTLNLDPLVSFFGDQNEEQRFKYPYAYLKYAFYQILTSNDNQGWRLLNDFDGYFAEHRHEKYGNSQLLGESAVLRSALAFNDLQKMMEHIMNAQKLLGDKKSLFRTRTSSFTHTSPHLTYGYFNRVGGYKMVVDIFSSKFESHIQVTDGCGAGAPALAMAEYALETGDFIKVEALAFQSMNEAKPFGQNWVIIGACLTLARLYYLQGRRDKLTELRERVLAIKKTEADTATLYEIDNYLGYTSALMNDIDGIPRWISNAELKQDRSMYERLSFNLIVTGKAILLAGDYKKLERKTYQFDHSFSAFDYQLGFIHNRIHRAVAKCHLYGVEVGCDQIKSAIGIAMPDHIIAPFLENFSLIAPMLDKLSNYEEYKGFIADLISNNADIDAAIAGSELTMLTSREIEIMDYVRAGCSQLDIAERLYISHNTVKRHLQNIYRKFSVTNKTQAINAYQKLHLNKMDRKD